MADMEKVIKGLREMSYRATWEDIDRIRHKFQPIINDAIVLLKEQEEKMKHLNNITLEYEKEVFRLQTLLKEQEVIVKLTKCPCGELFDAKDSSFCPKCGCAYGDLSGRYSNIGR